MRVNDVFVKGSKHQCHFLPLKGVYWQYLFMLKQFKKTLLISRIYVLGCFVNFGVIFESLRGKSCFLKEFVNLREIRNVEDLIKFEVKSSRWIFHDKYLIIFYVLVYGNV